MKVQDDYLGFRPYKQPDTGIEAGCILIYYLDAADPTKRGFYWVEAWPDCVELDTLADRESCGPFKDGLAAYIDACRC